MSGFDILTEEEYNNLMSDNPEKRWYEPIDWTQDEYDEYIDFLKQNTDFMPKRSRDRFYDYNKISKMFKQNFKKNYNRSKLRKIDDENNNIHLKDSKEEELWGYDIKNIHPFKYEILLKIQNEYEKLKKEGVESNNEKLGRLLYLKDHFLNNTTCCDENQIKRIKTYHKDLLDQNASHKNDVEEIKAIYNNFKDRQRLYMHRKAIRIQGDINGNQNTTNSFIDSFDV